MRAFELYGGMPEFDRQLIRSNFGAAVNMTAGEIEAWLRTPESRRVGFRMDGQGESVGHASGRRIVAILGKAATDLTASVMRTCARSSAS